MFMKFFFIMHMILIKSTNFLDQRYQSANSRFETIISDLNLLKQRASQNKLRIQKDLNVCKIVRNEIFEMYDRSFPSDLNEKNNGNNLLERCQNLITKYETDLEEIDRIIISSDQKIQEAQTTMDDLYNMAKV